MAKGKEQEYTDTELEHLEESEYSDSVRRLLPDPDFRRFLVRWLVEARDMPLAPVIPEDLPYHNWAAGRADLMQQFIAGVRELSPEVADEIEQEVHVYVQRRRRAQRPDDPDWG